VAALRFAVADGADPTTLTLGVADARGPVDVGACPATAGWTPAQAGAWSSRPPHDCAAGAARGTLSPDGLNLTFDVAGLPTSSALDVVLVPGKDAVTGLNATFQLALEPPDGTALAVQQQVGAGGSDVDVPAPAPDLALESGALDGGGLVPATPVGPVPVTPGAGNATPHEVAAPGRPRPAFPVPTASRTTLGDGRGFRSLMAVLFVVLGGTYLRLSTRPLPAPRLLGRLGSHRAVAGPGTRVASGAPGGPRRGIGRFARPRSGPAPRL